MPDLRSAAVRLIPSSICVALTLGLLASCSSSSSPKSVESSLASQKDKDKEKEKDKAKTSQGSKGGTDARLMDQANQYARDGLYREALQSFGEYLDKNPSDAAAHRTVGIIYVKTGVYKKALQHLNKAFAVYPNNFELNFYLGEAMRMQNRYADGIYHYKRALEADPKNTNTLKALAWSYYNIRYYSEAIRTARLLRTLAPNDFQVSIILARVLNKTDMNDKALSILNRSETLTSADNLPFLNSVKGDILYSMGDKAGAEQAYRKALQDQPLLPGALIGLAKKLIDDKKPSNEIAITYLDRALKIRPNMIEAYYLLGKAYQKSNPGKALEYYKIFTKEAT
ncbi:MAG: tetratricopeptide repeat protein, partial [Proteobacteria bacterium]